jgi:hypothetical protein
MLLLECNDDGTFSCSVFRFLVGTQSISQSSVICKYAGLPIKKQVLFYLNDYKCNNKLPETK